jgi:hypothetical protein
MKGEPIHYAEAFRPQDAELRWQFGGSVFAWSRRTRRVIEKEEKDEVRGMHRRTDIPFAGVFATRGSQFIGWNPFEILLVHK